MRDEELMENAIAKFNDEARTKFIKGIREHNPDGTKGLSKMRLLSKLDAVREECIDLWFYTYAMEQDIIGSTRD